MSLGFTYGGQPVTDAQAFQALLAAYKDILTDTLRNAGSVAPGFDLDWLARAVGAAEVNHNELERRLRHAIQEGLI